MKLFIILLLSISLYGDSIFYQPLTKDKGKVDFSSNFTRMKQENIDTLILQWTRHGDVDFIQEINWLEHILKVAQKHNIKVIIGLYADDNYFKILENKNLDVELYLNILKERNIDQAKSINEIAKKYDSFYAWYIYDEINDSFFRERKKQELLKNYLQDLVLNLNTINKKPLYISGYFTMQMEPSDYAVMFSYITSKNYIVLLQSGIGAGLVNELESSIYMQEFYKYFNARFIPIVESFNIKNSQTDPISKEEFNKQAQMLRKNTKQNELSIFSLRYFFKDSIK